ncbi:hypothetical protein BLNAU_19995 [Blattamonas nauphoetae]|uniref:Uncharacterized protein n=1 Tax=Blattamonas nauphoetae TaxID=2049346 RepID=A0ABQ9X074_9EUKA|nr:hypothetical protein BLNAU_19995 [Blattamonas nauphoetae]
MTPMKQHRSKVIAISVNEGPFVGTNILIQRSTVGLNEKTLRIDIGKLMFPMKAPCKEFLKSQGMMVAEQDWIDRHVNRDAEEIHNSAIKVRLCDINATNLGNIPQTTISNKCIGLFSFTCLTTLMEEVKMIKEDTIGNIPLTFADRLARITEPSPDSPQVDAIHNSRSRRGQKTLKISIVVERNSKSFGKWVKAYSERTVESIDDLLTSLALSSDESLTDFVRCIGVLVSSASKVITTAAVKMLKTLHSYCLTKINLSLVKADLITLLINTLNTLSFSLAEAADLHNCLIHLIANSLWLATPSGHDQLTIKDRNERLAVLETVLKQVVTPSEKYLCHLCVNRFSIIDGGLSKEFVILLTRLLGISPSYQPTIEIVLHIPVVLTIASCLAYFENDSSIWTFLIYMVHLQREWNRTQGTARQQWKTMHRMLRMEGIEDGLEAKLKNDRNGYNGGSIVINSIKWNNQLSMNLPDLW